jgi:DNA-directed RNA polymerase specialized sigma24 family protein
MAADSLGAAPGAFPFTRESLLRAVASPEPDLRRQAFGALAEGYWSPVYKYLRRRWRAEATEAEDLVQGFFALAFEKRWFDRFEPARGRFRTFLRVCLDAHVSHEREAAGRLKRGGGALLLSLDVEGAERELARDARGDGDDFEAWFHREWVRALFTRAVAALEREARAQGRLAAFEVFRRYDLADEEERPTYDQIARDLGLPVTQVTNHLAAMRRELRREVLDALRALTASEEEFRAEARDLLGIAG